MDRIAIGSAGFVVFLVVVRIVSMIWALVRLYDFRLTRVGEDLRSEYGLFTKVAATVPIRRVQAITINAGPLHRWLERATVRVATAGGGGKKSQSAANVREWLAPLIHQQALPHLLQQVLPGFDLSAVKWQPVHPRAFARAVKPMLLFTAIVTLGAAFLIGWGAIGVLILMLFWGVISTRQYVAYLGWAEDDEVVMMTSGWIWQQITLARVNKIQAVAMHQTPSIAARRWRGCGSIPPAPASSRTGWIFRIWISRSPAGWPSACRRLPPIRRSAGRLPAGLIVASSQVLRH